MAKKKWDIYGIVSGSVHIGEVEADTKEEALEMGEELDWPHTTLCWHCADEIDLGDIYKIQADEID